jgi:xanthine dehydrogenase accessory factor
MSDIEIFRKAIELSESGRAFAFASVIRAFGSTPQKAGANAIFAADGRMWGTLGGGCLEAECRRRALESIDDGVGLVFDLTLDDIKGWDDGLICGGRVRVIVDPRPSKNIADFKQIMSAHNEGVSGALLTFVQHPVKELGESIFYHAPELADCDELKQLPTLGELVEQGNSGSVSGSLDGADVEIYLEPFLSKPKLVIAGAGHIGKATAHLGALMGFEVIVIDDRPSLACKENLPDAAQTICGDIPSEMAQLATNDQTYVVIVTRGHRHDGTVLAAAVKKPSAFIGMIGSRRKGLMIRRGLIEEGLATESELDQVCSPIGVDIGSVTVPEIALSIVTQLVAVRRKRQWGAPAMNYGLEDYSHRPRGGTGSTDGATEAAPTVGR